MICLIPVPTRNEAKSSLTKHDPLSKQRKHCMQVLDHSICNRGVSGETSIHLECVSINTKYIFQTVVQKNPDEIWPMTLQITSMAVEAPLRGQTSTAGNRGKISHKTLWLYLALAIKHIFLKMTSSGTFLDAPV